MVGNVVKTKRKLQEVFVVERKQTNTTTTTGRVQDFSTVLRGAQRVKQTPGKQPLSKLNPCSVGWMGESFPSLCNPFGQLGGEGSG